MEIKIENAKAALKTADESVKKSSSRSLTRIE